MSWWGWVLVFAVLGVLALGVFALLALRLWRKARTVLSQVGRLTQALDTAALDRQPAGARGGVLR